jgi:5-(aminomethyl)-3-furanmethanol phosphate kinase
MTSGFPLRVLKVGGSLFDFEAFPQAWNRWLAVQPPATNVLIAGGGKLADAIREADQAWGLGDELAHWLCIDLLAASARLLAAILKDVRLEHEWERLLQRVKEREVGPSIVFCPVGFLRQSETRFPPQPLPHDWSVTSDSIAARITGILDADELVLLKSADPPAQAQPPYVDEYFVRAAESLNCVRFVNLRRYA